MIETVEHEICMDRVAISWNVMGLIYGGNVKWRTVKELRGDNRNGILCSSDAFEYDRVVPEKIISIRDQFYPGYSAYMRCSGREERASSDQSNARDFGRIRKCPRS